MVNEVFSFILETPKVTDTKHHCKISTTQKSGFNESDNRRFSKELPSSLRTADLPTIKELGLSELGESYSQFLNFFPRGGPFLDFCKS